MDITIEHPFLAAKKQLLKLCKPLFQYTPVTFFCYGRCYYNGECSFLTQEPDLDYIIFKKNLMPSVEELHLNTSHYILMSNTFAIPEMAVYPDKYQENIQITTEFGFPHRLFLVFYFSTHVEAFEFGIHKDKKNIMEFFMNHVELLERFCMYFREAGQDLIDEVDNAKIRFDDVEDPFMFNHKILNDTAAYHEFLEAIKLKKYRIQGKYVSQTLSKREFECLILSAKDKTAKQIGQQLNLSPRTVEDYLLNIKNKLGCESKIELTHMAHQDPLLRFFIE